MKPMKNARVIYNKQTKKFVWFENSEGITEYVEVDTPAEATIQNAGKWRLEDEDLIGEATACYLLQNDLSDQDTIPLQLQVLPLKITVNIEEKT